MYIPTDIINLIYSFIYKNKQYIIMEDFIVTMTMTYINDYGCHYSDCDEYWNEDITYVVDMVEDYNTFGHGMITS